MAVSTINDHTPNPIDRNALALAISALRAVRELVAEAANGQPEVGSIEVSPNDFACLLELIICEMRTATGDA